MINCALNKRLKKLVDVELNWRSGTRNTTNARLSFISEIKTALSVISISAAPTRAQSPLAAGAATLIVGSVCFLPLSSPSLAQHSSCSSLWTKAALRTVPIYFHTRSFTIKASAWPTCRVCSNRCFGNYQEVTGTQTLTLSNPQLCSHGLGQGLECSCSAE